MLWISRTAWADCGAGGELLRQVEAEAGSAAYKRLDGVVISFSINDTNALLPIAVARS